MDKIEILETLAAAKTYLHNLRDLEDEITNAEKQILHTFEDTEKNIRRTFLNLKNVLSNFLENREHRLLNEAEKIKNEGLTPLDQCHNIINQKIENTQELIKLGESLNVENHGNGRLVSFTTQASLLGSLPEVPELKEVPYITFSADRSLEDDLRSMCSTFGDVYRIAPIQISGLQPKPGALLVEWQSVDNDERLKDIQDFRLQRAYGNVLKEKHLVSKFTDCYKGLDTQFLIRDLQINQDYSFRVCCKFEGASDWCPWSLTQVASTSLRPFCWKDTEGFLLTNDKKIATNLCDSPAVLFSDGAQFSHGHSVEFTILDVDNKASAVLGLVKNVKNNIKNLQDCGEHSFLLDKNGNIFINGTEKSTKLPGFTKGLKICFTCELHNNSKIRINIDSSDKRVTYDWSIDADTQIFFACQLGSSGWKVMVE